MNFFSKRARNLHETADVAKFTEEILNEKHDILCSALFFKIPSDSILHKLEYQYIKKGKNFSILRYISLVFPPFTWHE